MGFEANKFLSVDAGGGNAVLRADQLDAAGAVGFGGLNLADLFLDGLGIDGCCDWLRGLGRFFVRVVRVIVRQVGSGCLEGGLKDVELGAGQGLGVKSVCTEPLGKFHRTMLLGRERGGNRGSGVVIGSECRERDFPERCPAGDVDRARDVASIHLDRVATIDEFELLDFGPDARLPREAVVAQRRDFGSRGADAADFSRDFDRLCRDRDLLAVSDDLSRVVRIENWPRLRTDRHAREVDDYGPVVTGHDHLTAGVGRHRKGADLRPLAFCRRIGSGELQIGYLAGERDSLGTVGKEPLLTRLPGPLSRLPWH